MRTVTESDGSQSGMRYLVGYVPDDSGTDALALARLLGGPTAAVTVCSVVPQTRLGGDAAHGGPGYEQMIGERVEEAQRATGGMVADADFRVHFAPSAAVGLLEVAEQVDASMIVLGSSRSGAFGRYVIGSVAGALQHASPVPLAFAPEGFAETATETVTRISCGYHHTAEAPPALDTAVTLCRAYQVPLRLLTFAFPEYPYLRGLSVMASPHEERHENIREAEDKLAQVAATVPDDVRVDIHVANGGNVGQAVAQPGWQAGELLVLGSARLGPLSRVFLGSTALKILRTCPTPVVAVARGAALQAGPSNETHPQAGE